ncbi:MAG: hypothetical protein ACI976_000018 [Aureispira sp.]|jgi:hypothetical protein
MSEKKKNPVAGIIFLMFVIILPVVTVLFSQWGLDRHKGIRSEMQFLSDSIRVDFGQLSTFQNASLTNESIRDKLVLAGFWDYTCKDEMGAFIDSLKALRNNFTKPDQAKLLFVIHTEDFSQDSTWSLEESIATWKIDTSYWKFTKGIDRGRYNMNTNSPSGENCFSIAVLDGRVSRKDDSKNYKKGPLLCDYYDLKDRETVQDLLRHLAVIIPLKQRKKIEWKQEEKLY